MYKFATLVRVIRFRRITYYTIQLDQTDPPLYSQFIKRHTSPEYKEDMDLIRSWMKNLGETIGASSDYFRSEQHAHAIPPAIGITKKGCRLRLYCLRINHRVVILFDGGIKTTQAAQDCPNVGLHFKMANRLAIAIWKAIDDGCIEIDENDDLVLDPETKIAL